MPTSFGTMLIYTQNGNGRCSIIYLKINNENNAAEHVKLIMEFGWNYNATCKETWLSKLPPYYYQKHDVTNNEYHQQFKARVEIIDDTDMDILGKFTCLFKKKIRFMTKNM